jgi:hypothetical protein
MARPPQYAPDDDDLPPTVLERWWQRMQRSHAFFAEGVFEDEEFENLVAALVTGATIEGLLWLGIQFCDFEAEGKKTMPLGALLREGTKCGLIGVELERLLVAFGEIRNDFAHDPDYRLNREAVAALRSLLPGTNAEQVGRACANIYPTAPDDVVASLVYEQIALLTYEAVRAAYSRKYGDD